MTKGHDKGQMSDREVMRLALENICGAILCEINPMSSRKEMLRLMDEAIAALHQALEQPECNKHPDAPHGFNRESSHSLGRYVCDCEGWEPEPWDTTDMAHRPNGLSMEQSTECVEPVAWLSRDDARLALWDAINKREFGNPTDDKLILDHLRKNGLWIGKYTSPPASKPWVGLTDVEWMNIVNKDHAWFGQRPEDVAHEVAKLVEAKLKEKNT